MPATLTHPSDRESSDQQAGAGKAAGEPAGAAASFAAASCTFSGQGSPVAEARGIAVLRLHLSDRNSGLDVACFQSNGVKNGVHVDQAGFCGNSFEGCR